MSLWHVTVEAIALKMSSDSETSLSSDSMETSDKSDGSRQDWGVFDGQMSRMEMNLLPMFATIETVTPTMKRHMLTVSLLDYFVLPLHNSLAFFALPHLFSQPSW